MKDTLLCRILKIAPTQFFLLFRNLSLPVFPHLRITDPDTYYGNNFKELLYYYLNGSGYA